MVLCLAVRASFIQLHLFASRWARLGLDDEATRQLENEMMQNPSAAPIVRGTGGARKIRFAPASWHSGKSGSVRVIYAFFDQFKTVVLITAYGKNEKANITDGEAHTIKTMLEITVRRLRGES